MGGARVAVHGEWSYFHIHPLWVVARLPQCTITKVQKQDTIYGDWCMYGLMYVWNPKYFSACQLKSLRQQNLTACQLKSLRQQNLTACQSKLRT